MGNQSKELEMKYIESQFGNPRGLIGHLVGIIMAIENRQRNSWALSLLDIDPADQILEIGFGPGWAIQRASMMAVDGLVAGVEPSRTMLAQAKLRNRIGIRSELVDLRSGTAATIPFEGEQFDKVYAVNSFHEWGEAMPGLMEARRVLKPGGLLAIVEHPHGKLDAKRIQEIQYELTDKISSAGFDVMQYTNRIQGRTAIAIVGKKLEPNS
jgi:ubiquinone/menaquinone biosynthesis C-methylase UbiE